MLKQAWLQAKNNKINTALYIVGVAMAVAMVMVMAMIWNVRLAPMYPEYNRPDIVISNGVAYEDDDNTYVHLMPYYLIDELKSGLETAQVAVVKKTYLPAKYFDPVTFDEYEFKEIGCDPEYFKIYDYNIRAGRVFTRDEFDTCAEVALIDTDTAQKLFGSPENAIGKTLGNESGALLSIIGVYDAVSELMSDTYANVLYPYTLAPECSDTDAKVGPFDPIFLLNKGHTLDDLVEELQEREHRTNTALKAAGSSGQYSIYKPEMRTTQQIHYSNNDNLNYFIFIGIVLLLVPAMNLSGLITEGLRRRYEEMGLRQTFGASRLSLLKDVVLENLVVTLIGSLIGLILSWIIITTSSSWIFGLFNGWAFRSLDNPLIYPEMLFSWRIFGIVVISTLILNLVVTLVPAWWVLRKNIVEALYNNDRHTQKTSKLSIISTNAWLFIELIIIVVLAWKVIDPVMVLIHDKNQPLGYDADRLVCVSIKNLNSSSRNYDASHDDSTSVMNGFYSILNTANSHPQVQCATIMPAGSCPETGVLSQMLYRNEECTDTIRSFYTNFFPGTHFFETMGIKPVSENVTAADLDSFPYTKNDIVFTTSLSQRMFGSADSKMKTLVHCYIPEQYATAFTTENYRINSLYNCGDMVFMPIYPAQSQGGRRDFYDVHQPLVVMIRVKDGIDPNDFVRDNGEWMRDNMQMGNYVVNDIASFSAHLYNFSIRTGYIAEVRMTTALLLFFMVNVLLGVAGTYYLQTRRRTHEAGVRKSFGASSAMIINRLMLEGIMLTIIAWAIGCGIYMQYAIKHGLVMALDLPVEFHSADSWITNFPLHFAVVSAIILAVLLLSTAIGVYIPAMHIGRISPVDALKDE